MRALIVGPRAGSERELGRALRQAGFGAKERSRALRIAVDGGLRAMRQARLRPHFAVGDWDSLGEEPRGLPHLTLSKDKDRSDLHYACRTALSLGATDFVCVGVTGGRPDHQLATLFDLSELASRRGVASVTAVDASCSYHFLSERAPCWRARLERGQRVSVFALWGPARGVTLRGFRFSLGNAELQPSSRGLSNRALGGEACVRLGSGRLVVMVIGKDFR